MPPRKKPRSLHEFCIQKIGLTLLEAAVRLDQLRYLQKDSDLSDDVKNLVRSLPGGLSGSIIEHSIKELCSRYKRELGCILLSAQKFMIKLNSYEIPCLETLFLTCIQSNVTKLDFSGLVELGPVSDRLLTEFDQILAKILGGIPKILELIISSHNNFSFLPKIGNRHLKIIGENCPELVYLDISYNRIVNDEGIQYLIKCPNLVKLFIFECKVFDKDVVKLLENLKSLKHLGFKATAKAVKALYKSERRFRTLNLTHIDNTGSKNSNLRCKKPIILAMSELCPGVENLKLRVKDVDVENLGCLEKVKTVELIYMASSSPGEGTISFLKIRGCQLTSIAFMCSNMTATMILTVGECCPGLTQFWCRSNYFLLCREQALSSKNHFKNLKILYFRVGENELSVASAPPVILPYVLKHASELRELIVVMRANYLNDGYLHDLLSENRLIHLTKCLFVVPGFNNLPNIIPLTIQSLHFLLDYCPNLTKVGNCLSWTGVEDDELRLIEADMKKSNYAIEIINRKMTMR